MPSTDNTVVTSAVVTSPVEPLPAADCHAVAGTSMSSDLSSELLVEIAAGLGGSAVADLLPNSGERRWALVLESEAYEAWVIAWPAGTGLELHDHNGSAAAVHIVNGRLRERYVDETGELAVRWLSAGDTVALPGDHQHEVVNLESNEVISVHVYSPPLADQSFRTARSMG